MTWELSGGKGFGVGDYSDGTRIFHTDLYFDPIRRKAAELGLPVNIHVADPISFYHPLDEHNEQLASATRFNLQKALLTFDELIDRRNAMMARNRQTTFTCCHMGNLSHDLGRLGRNLDAHPNRYVDILARSCDLGRQPKTARAFFIQYQDRVLYGTDLSPGKDHYLSNIRLFETEDEYFTSPGTVRHWRSYGMNLPDAVLRKLYNENAKRIIPGL
ncbi:MAG: amidohydrolase family protein [Verrucomicrobia bacterium]|nr:amidohydrolase family protein [Verrucomicrobiota bacterium]